MTEPGHRILLGGVIAAVAFVPAVLVGQDLGYLAGLICFLALTAAARLVA